MTRSYIVEYSVPATETRRGRSGSYRGDTLFFTYEDIVFNSPSSAKTAPPTASTGKSPAGRADGEPLLTIHRHADGSVEESGPLALPPRGHHRFPCPGCSSETGICFHRITPAQSDIYRGGSRIGEIATFADDGARTARCTPSASPSPGPAFPCVLPLRTPPSHRRTRKITSAFCVMPGPAFLSAGPFFAPPPGLPIASPPNSKTGRSPFHDAPLSTAALPVFPSPIRFLPRLFRGLLQHFHDFLFVHVEPPALADFDDLLHHHAPLPPLGKSLDQPLQRFAHHDRLWLHPPEFFHNPSKSMSASLTCLLRLRRPFLVLSTI